VSLNNFQKNIYNTHLKHFRNGGPWKARQDFSDISVENKNYLNKLEAFFSKFKHISLDDFFEAPRILHPDEPTPLLHFFTTRAAIKNYNLAQKIKLDRDPDQQIVSIKVGLEYITSFCLKTKIQLEEYPNHFSGIMPTWTEHYRQHLVNPYCLMEFKNLNINFESDEMDLWIPNLRESFKSFKTRYHNSNKTKFLVKEAYKKLSLLINQELTKSPN
jgi:hypothetical protein